MRLFAIGKLLGKSLVKKPATRNYPASSREPAERTRGHVEIDIDACIYCGMCQRKCPTGAITVSRPEKTWAIERLNCVQCSSCVDNCPKKCLSMGVERPHVATKFGKEVHARVSDNTEHPANS